MKYKPGDIINNEGITRDTCYKYLIMQMTNSGYIFLPINTYDPREKSFYFYQHHEK